MYPSQKSTLKEKKAFLRKKKNLILFRSTSSALSRTSYMYLSIPFFFGSSWGFSDCFRIS